MSQRLNFVEINYHFHQEFGNPDEVIQLHAASNLFAHELAPFANVTLLKHMAGNDEIFQDNIRFRFFRSAGSFFHIPIQSHRSVRQNKPDLVIVQGLIFPLQVIALRRKLGNNCVILLQHHGELPYRKKRIFQRIADRFVNGYLFTSIGNADAWRKCGVIKNKSKCFEIPSSSTLFSKKNKQVAKEMLGLTGDFNFLWVGRLDANKDPMTVITAFEKYIEVNPEARLYMIYQTNDLLEQVEDVRNKTRQLKEKLALVGEMPHHKLETWYNASDYYISGSHHEGGSYALTEAMACGCVPIVTSIPAAMKAIDNGNSGYHYSAGDSIELFKLLCSLKTEYREEMSSRVHEQFLLQMSPKAIAGKILNIYSHFRQRKNVHAVIILLIGTILQCF